MEIGRLGHLEIGLPGMAEAEGVGNSTWGAKKSAGFGFAETNGSLSPRRCCSALRSPDNLPISQKRPARTNTFSCPRCGAETGWEGAGSARVTER